MDIKKVIKSKGFTTVQVAQALGVTQPALSKMLKQDANPGIKKLQEIADIIGVSLPELVADSEDDLQGFIICPHCGKRIKLSVGK